jgi:hypothetical protein
VPINNAPGIFSGGTVTVFATSAGGEADYLVIGWTGPYATYDAAYAADLATPNSSLLGMSAIATTATGDVFHTPPGTPVSLSTTFAGITLAPLYSRTVHFRAGRSGCCRAGGFPAVLVHSGISGDQA